MFSKLSYTNYHPDKPTLIWDGDCNFCRYWVKRWERQTGNKVNYVKYQEILDKIHDIPKRAFKEALRLIDTDGKIYNGPEAAYKALSFSDKKGSSYRQYHDSELYKLFSDHGYSLIARNRPTMYKFSRWLWGNNPQKVRHYWIIYLALLVVVITIILSMALF